MDILAMDAQEVLALSGDELIDLCRELGVLGNRVAAMQTLVTDRIRRCSEGVTEGDSLAASRGCRNATELVQSITGEAAATVRARFRLGRQIGRERSLLGEVLPPAMDHVAKGMASGRLNFQSACMISSMLAKHSVWGFSENAEVAQKALVQAATAIDLGVGKPPVVPLHTDDIRGLCKRWDGALDPDGPAPDDETRFLRRFLNLSEPKDGLVRITGLLTIEAAAAFAAVSDSVNNPRAEMPIESNAACDASAEPGADAGSPVETNVLFDEPIEQSGKPVKEEDAVRWEDERSPGQRRHDALEMALNAALSSQRLPKLGGTNATVVVEVKEEALASGHGVGWLVDNRGESTAISLGSVHTMACAGTVQTVARNSLGRITRLGTPARIFNANQRRSIALRDRGCVIPGCTVPASWCEVHHVIPHSEDGPTHTDNGVLLCFHHHRNIDNSGWIITMPKGVPKVEPPEWLKRMHAFESGSNDRFEEVSGPDEFRRSNEPGVRNQLLESDDGLGGLDDAEDPDEPAGGVTLVT